MTTKFQSFTFLCLAGLGSMLPASAGLAPAALNSITVEFVGTKATYPDDRGTWVENLSKDDLTTGPFRYSKPAPDTGVLSFTNWQHSGETYTGSFTLYFTSASEGTFYKDYTGSFTGYISGTFRITAMDVPGLPVAKGKTVNVKKNQRTGFRLQGKGLDIRDTKLGFMIVSEPKVGKLNAKNLPAVVYTPKSGFTGTVKFTFAVKEGRSVSKPATVKLVVPLAS